MPIKYGIQRLLEAIPTIFVVLVLVFALLLFIPGDPILFMLGVVGTDSIEIISPEVYEAMRQRLGLDQNVVVRFFNWAWNVVQGDLGHSNRFGVGVADIIWQRLPATIYLGIAAIIIGLVLAIPLGVLAAIHQGKWIDHVANGLVLFGLVTPSFWVALLFVLVFAVYLDWLPTFGYTPPSENFVEFLKHIAMPATVMGIDLGASSLRYLRADFIEQMEQDYARTARAKGLPERIVFWKHVLKNSMVSFVTVLGFDIQRLLGGSTIIETMFAYPGISFLMLQSIFNRDYAVVQGVVLFIAILVIVINLVVDFIYSVLDPRVRYA